MCEQHFTGLLRCGIHPVDEHRIHRFVAKAVAGDNQVAYVLLSPSSMSEQLCKWTIRIRQLLVKAADENLSARVVTPDGLNWCFSTP
jgi:hypothetical protein